MQNTKMKCNNATEILQLCLNVILGVIYVILSADHFPCTFIIWNFWIHPIENVKHTIPSRIYKKNILFFFVFPMILCLWSETADWKLIKLVYFD